MNCHKTCVLPTNSIHHFNCTALCQPVIAPKRQFHNPHLLRKLTTSMNHSFPHHNRRVLKYLGTFVRFDDKHVCNNYNQTPCVNASRKLYFTAPVAYIPCILLLHFKHSINPAPTTCYCFDH